MDKRSFALATIAKLVITLFIDLNATEH